MDWVTDSPFTVERFGDYESWKASRSTKRMLFASEIAALMGCGFSGQSPWTVWLDKIGEGTPTKETKIMNEGKILEVAVIELFKDRHPEYTVERTSNLLLLREDQQIGCSPDAVYVDETGKRGLLETKVSGLGMLDEWMYGNVPEKYFWQVQHQMMVTGYDIAIIGVLLCSEYEERIVPRDPEAQLKMVSLYQRFWDCVESRTPPDWDYSEAGHAALRRKADMELALRLDKHRSDTVRDVLGYLDRLKEIDTERQKLANWLVASIGKAQYVVLDCGACVKIGVNAWKEMKKTPKNVEFCESLDWSKPSL